MKTVKLILLIITCWLFISASEPKTIYMILWRGETQAEKGFMNYLKSADNSINFLIRNCDKDKSKISSYISEINTLKPDLIYTFGTTVTTLLANKFDNPNNIPIVFNIVSDPIKAGILTKDNLSKKNITGASHSVPVESQIKAIRKIIDFKKVGHFYNGTEKNSLFQKEALEDFAKSDSFSLISFDIKNNIDENDIINFLKIEKPDIIYLPSDSYLISNAKRIIAIFNQNNIPVYSATEGPLRDAGAMFGLVSRYYNVGQLAGHKAVQILFDNTPASEIKFETLKRFSFIINIETSKKIELIPPLSVMKFAEIIKSTNKWNITLAYYQQITEEAC